MTLDSGLQVDAIYTDFSKAFDRVNHVILLAKLEALGITGPLIRWTRSYFTGRTQRVNIKGTYSGLFAVTSGVSQGSHLGRLLFIIFVNDIGAGIINSKFLLFADDHKLYRAIESLNDAFLLQGNLTRVAEWCALNRMELTAPKCRVLTVTRRKTGVVFRYSINNEALDSVQSIRDLGGVINKSVSFTEHYSGIISTASKMLGYIKKTAANFSDPRALTVLYTALVRPHLEYASPILSPGARPHVNRLEAVQRRFLQFAAFRLGMGINRSDHDYTNITMNLNIPSLETRQTVADLLLLYKVLNYILDSPGLLEIIRLRIPRVN